MSLTPRRTKRSTTPIRRPAQHFSPIRLRDQTRLRRDGPHRFQRLLRVQQGLQVISSRLRLAGRLALDREKGEGPSKGRRTRGNIILQMRGNHALEVPPTHAVDPVQRLHRISVEYKRLDDRRY